MTRQQPSWLEEAVFYQIYPQSFCDSNADGIGDLRGIISKLDYLASLGVSALWLNPCFESPFADAGYDVTDFYRVAPRYGTNGDLDELFRRAHGHGMRVILDLVAGHTSIEHPWFRESAKHERNAHSDWFIWTDTVWGSVPPGLPCVRGLAERDGAYVTNFFYCQPALNYGFAEPDPEHPWQQSQDAPGPRAVRSELRKIMEHWLARGADGFRVDMADSLVKNDPGKCATIAFWRDIRSWLDRKHPEAFLISEWSFPRLALAAGFHADFYIHFRVKGYNALFRKPFVPASKGGDPKASSVFDRSGRGNLREFLDEYLDHREATKDLGFMSLVSGNHDMVPRLSEGRDARDVELAFLFLLTMPGLPFIYYGDEIGMRTLRGLPSREGGYERTGVRTPMQWDASANAGFSTAHPGALYLPIDPSPERPTVQAQDGDPRSLLNGVRTLVLLRRRHRALQASGEFTPLCVEGGGYPIVYRRSAGTEAFLVAINPTDRAVETRLTADTSPSLPQILHGDGTISPAHAGGWLLRLPPVSGGVFSVAR